MNKRQYILPFLLLVLAALATSVSSHAQSTGTVPYRTDQNPLYWKNRKPDAAYWQQDVHYKIVASIDEENHMIDALQELDYWNNSPDTLTYVYFHLYQNAFIKGSYLHQLEEANKQKARLGKREAAGLGTMVSDISVNGQAAPAELDNTILKVYLPDALPPGGKAHFEMSFKTWWDNGSTRRRMQLYNAWGFTHYNGVQWFPKMCVYDRKFGWDTYQHLNKEFYGDFGVYDVTLDFPSNYIVEATGALQNRDEVLPPDLRRKLDISNFSGKPWNEKPSVVIPYDKKERKKWHFVAENVHDFAFTADPSYRIGTTYWNGIECVALVQEPHASGWQNAASYVASIIKTFSEDIGMYQYPKMVAADANDGMEYPMLTLDGGRDPGYRGLLVHEIAHNWFYGMVGSNETYRAALDEGFTQFLTAWGLRRIDGDTLVQSPEKSAYRRRFTEPVNAVDVRVLNAYTYDALNRNEVPLNTHSNDFNDALGHEGGYRLVYYKTASMLYNLQYALGDSLFQAAFRNYFNQWRFGHPYFEDFRSSIIQFTHADLNWFFDQWLETTKPLDYAVGGIRKMPGIDKYAITFKRKGEMQMPVDFTVLAKDGQRYNYYIPNTVFEKDTRAVVLPRWFGWGRLNRTYKAEVQVPGGIRSVQIDTTYRLADRNMTDNYKRKGWPVSPDAMSLKWENGLNKPWDRRKYRIYMRPDLWWNPVDGIKAGVHLESDYLFSLYKTDATIWLNTHLLQHPDYYRLKGEGIYKTYMPVNYTFNYLSPLSLNMPKVQVQINSRLLDGLWYHRGGFNYLPDARNTIQLSAQTLWRQTPQSLDYLIYPQEWSSMAAHPNASLNLAWERAYNYFKGNGRYRLSARAPFLSGNNAGSFNYSYLQLEAVNYNYLGKLELRTRFFGRYGMGKSIPSESALYLGGANPEQLMEDKYTRSAAFIPDDWRGISRYEPGHFQQGGGLNLRGYAGYFAPEMNTAAPMLGYKGRSGVAVNAELDIDNYFRYRPKWARNWLHVDAYLFADAGVMELSTYSLPEFWKTAPVSEWSDLRVDAGAGVAFTIKKWGIFEQAKPLTIRFDFPLFLNRPSLADPQYVTLRWLVGINRSF